MNVPMEVQVLEQSNRQSDISKKKLFFSVVVVVAETFHEWEERKGVLLSDTNEQTMSHCMEKY